ncbi:MAG TPA: ATP-binding protein [Kofleriaceae bacterium]|nr:ATP-binding protein [Kofleriaceae bacterium]
MKEVSSRIFSVFLKPLAAKGIAPETMVAGTEVTLARLRNKQERIDWAECCAIMRNLSVHFTEAEYREIGRSYFRSPGLRFAFVIARLMLTPMGFYRWINKPRDGAGNQMFTCIRPTHRELNDHECEVDLLIDEGLDFCPEFFSITVGNFEEMPRLLGYPAAKVQLARLPRGGRFHIEVPTRPGLLTRMRRAITWPFTVRAAARELQEAHETLTDRYEQLELARTQLDAQATQLRTAHRVNQLIQSDLDLDRAVDLIADALIDEAKFIGVELDLAVTMDDVPIERTTRRGATDGTPLHRELEGQGHQRIGYLRVFVAEGAAREDAEALLSFLVPSISMALVNAITFRVVEDYRRALERRVAARTRDLNTARDELTATVRRLEEVQLDRERLFQNISHEIRTPLVLILLAVDAVLEAHRPRLDRRATEHLETITTSARKLVRLVDELLLLAAGRERELNVSVEPIALGPAVDIVTAGWRLAAEAAGQTLEVVVQPDLVALADPTAVERILSNLLSNAIKFTPARGRITVRAAAAGGVADDMIALEVADTGPGIDDDLRGRLFGRFEQGTAGLASGRGSGIGLSLVQQLVHAHGGEIEAHPNTAAASGTIFRFTLPRSHAPAPDRDVHLQLKPEDYGAARQATPVPERFESRGPSQGLVLVAEDEPALARSIAEILSEDHTVLVAGDGLAALQLAERHPPDLLVTDIQMPRMDGLELTRKFLDRAGGPPVPVLMLTARGSVDDRIRGLGQGAVDYLTKPFDPQELRARVRAQLAYRRLTTRLHAAEKLASLGALSAGLAHELRNPANGIVNAVAPLKELLPPELADPESASGQLIDVMAECAEQVAFLSRQLLGFRRTGELELRRTPLREVVDRALANASAALSRVEVRTRLDFTGTVRCAPPAMTQVLVNLLENGAQAAGPGGWVEVASAGHNGTCVLEITDSGPGVPAQLREKIFEPFFTTKPPGQGTGLGLAISRDLVVRHGGTLEVVERGERTVFAIELPAAPPLGAATLPS